MAAMRASRASTGRASRTTTRCVIDAIVRCVVSPLSTPRWRCNGTNHADTVTHPYIRVEVKMVVL